MRLWVVLNSNSRHNSKPSSYERLNSGAELKFKLSYTSSASGVRILTVGGECAAKPRGSAQLIVDTALGRCTSVVNFESV